MEQLQATLAELDTADRAAHRPADGDGVAPVRPEDPQDDGADPAAGAAGHLGSSFGWRIDPFTGRSALHTGLDFQADPGTSILAAAGGVV
jgi:murein DD-endopeptidase MepM/ murein hydrolase activator NlpD